MADDHPQRTFRSTDPQSRATAAASNSPAGGNDPLAELARLIGQNDPFGEFGRGNVQQSAAVPGYAAPDAYPPRAPSVQGAAGADGAERLARHSYGSAPLAGSDDLYQPHGAVPGYEGYDEQAAVTGAYDDASYDPNMPYADGDQEYQDFYDDVPPPRRRMGVLAIGAVFALAVVGTAGAFGYRALFGSAGSGPPPVIKADATPSKIVPDKGKDQSAKLINDRINDASGGQKLVSREEQPVDLNKDKAAGVLTQAQSVAGAGAGAMQPPALGSGVIGSDPRKIHTITIRPDQTAMADASESPQADVTNAMPATQPAASPEPAQPAAHQASMAPTHEAPPRAAKPAPAPRHTVTHRVARAPHRVASASNAPLSLSPNASAPVRTAAARPTSAPTRLAPSSAQPAAAGGGYAVQVSSRRNQADARAALHRMQSRFASVLGGQQVMVRRVDLGAKGVYYRAMVGPFGSSDEAGHLCSRLKAAGGSCFVQRI